MLYPQLENINPLKSIYLPCVCEFHVTRQISTFFFSFISPLNGFYIIQCRKLLHEEFQNLPPLPLMPSSSLVAHLAHTIHIVNLHFNVSQLASTQRQTTKNIQWKSPHSQPSTMISIDGFRGIEHTQKRSNKKQN